jgi:hypothetical protein
LCSGYSDDFTEYLNNIVENNVFRDTMFYVCTDEGIDLENVFKWRDDTKTIDLIENVPAFMFNIDTKKRLEKKKWMIPDPYVTGLQNIAIGESWGDVVEMIRDRSEKVDFAAKRAKAYSLHAPHLPSLDEYKGKTLRYHGLDYLTKNEFLEHSAVQKFPRMDMILLGKKHPEKI